MFANAWIDTGETAAGLLRARRFTAQHVHIGRWAAEVGDHPGKARHGIANGFDLVDDRIFRTALNNAPLVLGNGAEGTAAEAAAHDVDREADHLIRRDTGVAVRRVRHAFVRQRKDAVHLFGGERDRRWVDPDKTLAVLLHQRTRTAGVGFMVQNTGRVGVEHLIGFHLLVGRQQHIGLFPRFRARRLHDDSLRFRFLWLNRFVIGARQIFAIRVRDRIDFARHIDDAGIHPAPARQRFFHHDGGVAHVADAAYRLALRQTVRHFYQWTLAVTVNQHVGFGVHQHRAAHGIRPVIIVRGTTQARLDAAQDHRHIFPGFFTALGVDQRGAVRAFARHVIRCVRIVMAQLTVGGITVDHRVHVAGGHAEEQVRFTQTHKVVFAVPVWLGDDPHAEALRFKHAAADGHTEARVVNVGIARDQNDIAAIPAQLVHLFPGHRQERRRSKAGRPVLGPREKVTIRLDQGNCAHNASEEKIDKRSRIIRCSSARFEEKDARGRQIFTEVVKIQRPDYFGS